MFLAWLTFLTGIAISVVAIYYSVLGLAAIFAAAVIPIVIMGTTLEVAKLVTAWWLKANWHRAPLTIKLYLLPSVIMLMIITSMGIFGFLSKAHTDQAVPLGDTAAQVSFIDEKINNERETIANARSLIKQLDDAVMGIQSGQGREIKNRDGSVTVENPAERALQIRRAQARDRTALTQTIEQAQARIVKLQEEKAPIAGKLRAVEAEVGPIKYIAKLIYGDNPDQNILEKAVVWVIIIIVMVFDPLAVLLLLASQMSFQWARQEQKERANELVQETTPPEGTGEEISPTPQPDIRAADEGNRAEQSDAGTTQAASEGTEEKLNDSSHSSAETVAIDSKEEKVEELPIDEVIEIEQPKFQLLPELEKELEKKERSALEEWNEMIAEAERAAEEEDDNEEDYEIIEKASGLEKAAMKAWKQEHPETCLKTQKLLFKKGIINKLPWEDYLEAKPDFADNEAAEEAAKWALEQLEESKKKDSDMDGNDRGKTGQEIELKIEGYVQNAEQNDSTIWQRVKKAKNNE
jgi:hypothetical protein